MNDTHVLYRIFDEDDALLYVGITNNPKGRILGHQSDKPWWPSVSTITLAHFPDREALEAAERVAVATEKPRFNVVLNEFTQAWCRAEGHVAPGKPKCEECRALALQAQTNRDYDLLDAELEKEYADDPFVRSMLGLNPPPGQRNLTLEELQQHPALKRYSDMMSGIPGRAS